MLGGLLFFKHPVGHKPMQIKCPPSPAPVKLSSRSLGPWLRPTLKVLPIGLLAAYPYLAVGYRNGDHYAASIGSLVWALTKGASDLEVEFDWG